MLHKFPSCSLPSFGTRLPSQPSMHVRSLVPSPNSEGVQALEFLSRLVNLEARDGFIHCNQVCTKFEFQMCSVSSRCAMSRRRRLRRYAQPVFYTPQIKTKTPFIPSLSHRAARACERLTKCYNERDFCRAVALCYSFSLRVQRLQFSRRRRHDWLQRRSRKSVVAYY